MADQRTMAELLRAPTEGYARAIVVPPILAEHFELKHSLFNMMTSDQFFGLEKDNPHDHIRWFNKITSTIKYKDVPNSAIKLMLFPFSLAGAARRWLEKEPPRSILTWEDLCLAADGNTFPKYQDNIQGYVAAATSNYNQGNAGYHPPGVVNQTRPPAFVQQNRQNNQNRFSQPRGYNRGNNFNHNATYEAPIQQNQSVPLSELEKIKKINDVSMKAMQNQINNVKNELRNEMQSSIQASMSNQTNELKNMMASFFQMNTASTSGSGSLPSNTVANSKGELNVITTRSGLVLDGPSVLMPPLFINPEEDERVDETLTDPEHGEFTIKVPPPLVQKAKPPSQRNYVVHQREPRYPHIPYPSRMNQEKRQEKDETSDYSLEEFADELAHFTFAPRIDYLPFDADSDLREIEYLLNHDPIEEMDSILEDSVNKNSPDDNLVDTISEMFTDEHALDYSSPPLWDDYDGELFDLETVNDNTYYDPFDSNEEKIKDSKILIDELDPPQSSDFLPFLKCDLVFYEDFSEVDVLSSTNNEDKVFKSGFPGFLKLSCSRFCPSFTRASHP
ncbi:hypothetical protein Tco_0121505 [Tanacetum coccineum]